MGGMNGGKYFAKKTGKHVSYSMYNKNKGKTQSSDRPSLNLPPIIAAVGSVVSLILGIVLIIFMALTESTPSDFIFPVILTLFSALGVWANCLMK